MLKDLLAKLGISAKGTVGVAVSPGLGVEMIEVDKLTGTVSKYGNRHLEYNSSTREIANYESFGEALSELFDELHISPKSNVVLSLPSVYFGISDLPMLLTEDAVGNALISEAEQSYIFKRHEPVMSWCCIDSNFDTETKTYAYSAIQQNVVDSIKEVFDGIGCTAVAIESSYASLFRALSYSDLAKEQMQDGASWNLLVVMQNNYSIFSLEGKKIISYTEEPLALKSFVDDEIYNAIKASAQLTLSGLVANYLFIISETDLVSSEVLSMKLSSDCPVKFLECNKFAQNEILPVSLNILPKFALQITPEAIGSAAFFSCNYPLKLNIMQKEDEGDISDISSGSDESIKVNIGKMEFTLTKASLQKIFVILAVMLVLPLVGVFFLLNNTLIPDEQSKLTNLGTKEQSFKTEIDTYNNAKKTVTFDPKATIKDVIAKNKKKLAYYMALGVSIPNKLWITEYKLQGDSKVDIKGQSNNVESIYSFYKSLKQLVDNSDIRLYKLELNSGSIDEVVFDIKGASRVYSFEITNMSDGELSPQPPASPQDPNAPPPQPGAVPAPPAPGPTPPPAPNASAPTAGQPTNSNGQAQTAPPPKPPVRIGKPIFGSDGSVNSTPSGSDPNLPPNLKKIEKF